MYIINTVYKYIYIYISIYLYNRNHFFHPAFTCLSSTNVNILAQSCRFTTRPPPICRPPPARRPCFSCRRTADRTCCPSLDVALRAATYQKKLRSPNGFAVSGGLMNLRWKITYNICSAAISSVIPHFCWKNQAKQNPKINSKPPLICHNFWWLLIPSPYY